MRIAHEGDLPEGDYRSIAEYTTLSVVVGDCLEGKSVSPCSDVTLDSATYSCP